MAGSIRKRNGNWLVIMEIGKTPDGKRLRKYTSVKTRKEAEQILAEHDHQVNIGTFVQPDHMLYADFLEHWMEHYVDKNCEATTKAGYEVVIRNYIAPYLGRIPLQKLAPIHIQSYYKHLMDERKLSPNTVYRHHANIRKSLDYALKKQLVIRNAADAVDLPKKKKFEGSYYTVEQLNVLLKKVKGSEIEVPVNLAAYLGLRRGEIGGLKWKHVDMENRTIHIQEVSARLYKGVITKTPKNETSIRTLYMHDDLFELLERHKMKQEEYRKLLGREYKVTDYVCTKLDGEPFRPEKISHRFTSLLKANKLPNIRLHDLRHYVESFVMWSELPLTLK